MDGGSQMILHSVLPSCRVKHLLLQFLLLFAVFAEVVEKISLTEKLRDSWILTDKDRYLRRKKLIYVSI